MKRSKVKDRLADMIEDAIEDRLEDLLEYCEKHRLSYKLDIQIWQMGKEECPWKDEAS